MTLSDDTGAAPRRRHAPRAQCGGTERRLRESQQPTAWALVPRLSVLLPSPALPRALHPLA